MSRTSLTRLVAPSLAVFAAIALVLGGVAPRAGAQSAPAAGERIDGVVATVNNEVILASEVDEQVYLFLAQNRARPDSAQLEQLRREVLDRIIEEKVIVSEAKRQNIALPEAELERGVDEAMADVKRRLGTESAYRAELAREGITEDDLRKRYREDVSRQMMAQALLRKQIGKVDVTPNEAIAYYTAHSSEFPKRPAALHAMVIQMPVEADSAAKRAVRVRADAAAARVKKGEPFSRLAQELSEDQTTAGSGGDLGWFGRNDLDSTFTKAAFNVPVGQVSPIVETNFGYHLIKVEESDATKGEIHARHILFRVTPTEKDAARVKTRMDDVRVQAVKGVDFGTLARRYSKYRGPAGPDGDLGFVPLNAFTPEFRAALDTLETGQLSQLLLNPQGWNLFKIVDREGERAYRVEEIKDQLPELVRQAKMRTQYESFVADLRKKAVIDYR